SSSSARRALTSIVPDLPCLLVMVCILAKGSGDCASPAYHDHPPQRLLQNFPDTTPKWSSSEATDENKASLERRYGDCRACAFRAGVPPPKPETIVARLSPKNESEADQRSQLPKLMALYPNSLSSLWIRPRRDPFEAR